MRIVITIGSIFKFLLICFISIYVLVTFFGHNHPGDSAYKTYRRLQEEILAEYTTMDPKAMELKDLKVCPGNMENFVPCYNVTGLRKCADSATRRECIIRTPKDYRSPVKWPQSKDTIWRSNVRFKGNHLEETGTKTNRLLLEEDWVTFLEAMDDMEKYSQQLETMISLGRNSTITQSGIRLVLDAGHGFGSLAAHFYTKGILTMSVAPYELHESRVQFCLERGLPAMIGSFLSNQLPFPSFSFDMIHCSKCAIEWHEKDGLLLIEADRMLRPGGYFVFTSKSENEAKVLETLAKGVCWQVIARQDQTTIWQKAVDPSCYSSRDPTGPPICAQTSTGHWYEPLKPCIGNFSKHRWHTVQQQALWPDRLLPSSSFMRDSGISADHFYEEMHGWPSSLSNYWSLLSPIIFSDHPKRPGDEDPLPPNNVVHNIMDMNAGFGGLNAALLQARKGAWVMNVVPVSGRNTLPFIYDRGLLGVAHDWCEPFPTYPRSYDMLFAASLLSQELRRCSVPRILLEMDRILRPEGWVLLRDESQLIEEARIAFTQLRWEARIIEIPEDTEQRLLICQKNWRK